MKDLFSDLGPKRDTNKYYNAKQHSSVQIHITEQIIELIKG